MKNAVPKKDPEMEWSPKNIAMFLAALGVLIGGVVYGLNTAESDLKEKRERLEKLTLAEVGSHILEHNSGTVVIDPITTMRGMHLVGNVMEIPYYVSDGFLHRVNGLVESTEASKRRVRLDLLGEDCSKTAFSVFMQKGGVMHYTYYLEKNGRNSYLFDFNNTWGQCD